MVIQELYTVYEPERTCFRKMINGNIPNSHTTTVLRTVFNAIGDRMILLSEPVLNHNVHNVAKAQDTPTEYRYIEGVRCFNTVFTKGK